MSTTKTEMLRWLSSRRAAEKRERLEQKQAPHTVESSVQAALALIAFSARLHGWPPKSDIVTTREESKRYRAWVLLRRKWVA